MRLGAMKARWSVVDFDKAAAKLKDAKYAGTMKPGGLFMPAEAGPIPSAPITPTTRATSRSERRSPMAGERSKGSPI